MQNVGNTASGFRFHVWRVVLKIFFGLWVLVFAIPMTGCVPQPSRTYQKTTVTIYAELTLLYEKEKLVNKQNDTSYQSDVNDFFKKKGLQEEQFRNTVNQISNDPEVWKFFMQDVSAAMDSLKIIQR